MRRVAVGRIALTVPYRDRPTQLRPSGQWRATGVSADAVPNRWLETVRYGQTEDALMKSLAWVNTPFLICKNSKSLMPPCCVGDQVIVGPKPVS